MATAANHFKNRKKFIRILLLCAVFLSAGTMLPAQDQVTISGKLVEATGTPVPYAYVSLYKVSDSTNVKTVVTDTTGKFSIAPVAAGKYRLLVHSIGYQPLTMEIEAGKISDFNTGILTLHELSYSLNEAVVTGERIKAKTEHDRTTFFVSEKMTKAAYNGVDILKHIPGIQIDLRQNISLEGSSNILILVDGKERDRSFVSQLNPGKLDKVEIINSPSSQYDSGITGVINIILKKDKDSGLSGQIVAEIPVSDAIMYLQPNSSINYSYKKLNISASYIGELIYADLHESVIRSLPGKIEIRTDQYGREQSWSHRINYGLDYAFNSKNAMSFYAFYNPWSREMDGTTSSQKTSDANISDWQAKKEDSNLNKGSYYSLYFKHIFNEKGNQLTVEINDYNLRSENTTLFTTQAVNDSAGTILSSVRPLQNNASMKTDYTIFPSKNLNLSFGIRVRRQLMQDANSESFKYSENIMAAYGSFLYRYGKVDFNGGLRFENSRTTLKNTFNNSYSSFLPNAGISFRINSYQNIKLAFSRSISRPNIYQLNPYTSSYDPWSASQGNTNLRPEIRTQIYLEHSFRLKNNYLATRLFYNSVAEAINSLMSISDSSTFMTGIYNLGSVKQYGIQLSATLKAGNLLSFNPWFRVYGLSTSGYDLARQNGITRRDNIEFETGLSGIVSFPHDISVSMTYQYSSPKNNIQGSTFSDALYFISIEKAFRNKLKAGVVSGLQFTRNFTWAGTKTTGQNFYSIYEGNMKIPAFPMLWFRLSYQFASGKKIERSNADREEIETVPRQGFGSGSK